jgi:hypothetical protein
MLPTLGGKGHEQSDAQTVQRPPPGTALATAALGSLGRTARAETTLRV